MDVNEGCLAVKRESLLAILRGYGRVAVAFSGGVDSAVVAKAAHLACGPGAVAFTAVSPSLASGESDAAAELAASIGIEHRIVATREFDDRNYLRNAPDRCYHCKSELYSRIEELIPAGAFDAIVNGANVDDCGDHRPGMDAARQRGVKSPLVEAGLNKAEVRQLAADWRLSVWDKPAAPCLSSRIAYGVEVTPERVRRVDLAEQFLRERFGLREFRVRHESGDLARIEAPTDDLVRLSQPEARTAISRRLHELGFRYVTIDLDGFRSGSMNAVVPIEALQAARRHDGT